MVIAEKINNSDNKELSHLNSKRNISKASLRRIDIDEFPVNKPDFQNSSLTKDSLLAQWLKDWIIASLKEGRLKKNDLMPKKAVLATYLNISVGTVQNAIRYVEDEGYLESKQRIGTLLRGLEEQESQLRKLTSKREQAIIALKKLIIDSGYNVEAPLPSSRELSEMIGCAANTTRLALEHLASAGIIQSIGTRGNKSNWILRKKPELSSVELESVSEQMQSNTLVDQVKQDLKDYIMSNCKLNDKLPPHFELSEMLKVSIKTVHDAMKSLNEEGILRSKRGRYGTTIARMPNEAFEKPENSIFASAEEASFYNYEKIENHIKQIIVKGYKVGDKLPTMDALSKQLDVSSNTIRKALQNLYDKNIVKFERGRYGGTFVINIPKEESQSSFTWLAINKEHMSVYSGAGQN